MPDQRKIGMVSLGCPKALVDSERILTQLSTDGYQISPNYEGADVVIVNTCGFIDSAKAESLEAIGEALDANGRVIVTGCMGSDEGEILKLHPQVLAVTGPQQYEAVVDAVHQHAPIEHQHDPYISLVPPQGIKLTPRHYAYLKISEGCNHKCTFCIIPSLRGGLVSRPTPSQKNPGPPVLACTQAIASAFDPIVARPLKPAAGTAGQPAVPAPKPTAPRGAAERARVLTT